MRTFARAFSLAVPLLLVAGCATQAERAAQVQREVEQMIQLLGGLSLLGGNAFGRVLGIIGAGLGALDALVAIGGKNPWWSLGVFALCIYILHGLIIFGRDVKASEQY